MLLFLSIIPFDYSQRVSHYSSLVYPLFQFKDVTVILKKTIYLWLYCSIAESEPSIVLSFAFEKDFSKRENTRSAAAEEGCTSII